MRRDRIKLCRRRKVFNKEKLSRELLFVYIELERQKQLSLCQKTAVSNERIRGSGSLGGESHTAAWPFRF